MPSPNDIVAVESKQHSSEPSSPLSSPSDQEHRPFDVEGEHQILHLVPCTWSQFLELDPPVDGNYDYVDGLVVHCPHMADREHKYIADSHKTILECKDSHLYVFLGPSLQVITEKGKTLRTTVEHRSGDGVSSTTQPIEGMYDLRHPDYVITSTQPDSTGCSSTDSEDANIEWTYPYRDKLKAVVEITSDSTRNVDLYTKWATYALSNVPLYVILDRGTANSEKKVIVGSLKQFSKHLKRMAHGDPDPSERPKLMPNDENAIYYRKVYNLDDKVDCPYFNQLNMTVKQMLDEVFVRKLCKKMYHERAERAERAEEWTKLADEWTKLADEKAKRAEEWTKLADEKAKRAEEWTKRADEWAKRADELQKERDYLEKVTEKATGKGYEELLRECSRECSASSSSRSPTQSPEKKKNRNN